MRERAPGKVNLCLYVGRARADGYHPVVSIIQPVGLADELRLEPEAERDEVVCPGVEGENLAARAIAGFREATGWDGPPVRITIDKHVPVAAGMGGGSSDAAAALRLLARHCGLAIPPGLPFSIGADVPALMDPARRALVTGAGEQVQPLAPGPAKAYVVLPSAHALATPDVFRRADELGTPRAELAEIERAVRADPDSHFINDLLPAALDLLPEIAERLARLEAAGARALLSGSGPTVFAVVEPADAERVAREAGGMVVR